MYKGEMGSLLSTFGSEVDRLSRSGAQFHLFK